MCHVQKGTSGIPLNPHVLGLGQPRKRAQSTRPCDLGLVILMRCQVGDAANGIALHLDVG